MISTLHLLPPRGSKATFKRAHCVPVSSVRHQWHHGAAMDQGTLNPGCCSVWIMPFRQRNWAQSSCSRICSRACVGSGPSLPFPHLSPQTQKSDAGRASMWVGLSMSFLLTWFRDRKNPELGWDSALLLSWFGSCLHSLRCDTHSSECENGHH